MFSNLMICGMSVSKPPQTVDCVRIASTNHSQDYQMLKLHLLWRLIPEYFHQILITAVC